ncbi:5-formyltetrahydrofolate cyclo-ligase [Halopseudomonas salegens]|uniref:5-formyltetrahydrofolate cyclo-ligase n=1 Tax=Halopseudomonas salegens TaxID=1434072 RepID=A0A1H2H2B5_9GAMM|nr:5-formyltetrahydrofolate cyclo-ligase [Halopseudomonas salegens]SDU25956.1 5-formyltetrahydrofolate cyclo-ligase [Halopseudomonas salegens]
MTRGQWRRTLRQRRRSLSKAQQARASRDLCRRIAQLPSFQRSRRIGLYLPNDGEIDPTPLLYLAQRRGKHCYLPVVSGWPRQQMRLQRLRPGQRWARNRFGINEPASAPHWQVKAWQLDLLLLPLVGFDRQGNRLGMGGGFYDRCLAYRQRRRHWRRPQLLGLAHQCQEVPQLPIADWDIPLDGIVTDRYSLFLQESGLGTDTRR